MIDPNVTTIAENIRRARSLGEIPPDRYLVPFGSIADLLDRQAAARHEKVFLYYHNDDSGEQAEWRYGEFNRRINQVANLLRDRHGVRRGDKVATIAFNHPDAVIAFLPAGSSAPLRRRRTPPKTISGLRLFCGTPDVASAWSRPSMPGVVTR